MPKITRRQFLKYTAIAGAAAALPLKIGVRSAHAFSNSMPLPKFAQAMRTFAVDIPVSAPAINPLDPNVDYHTVVAGWFRDTLHPGITTFQLAQVPPVPVTATGTRLLGYSGAGTVASGLTGAKHLGHSIVATKGRPVRIRFDNQLLATQIVPFDTTITQGIGVPPTQDRAAIHLHGGLTPWTSDGGPFHWLKSGTSTLPAIGSVYGPSIVSWLPDTAGNLTNDYYHPNLQSARFMWYHDHAIGITRTNAYSGVAAGYLLTDPTDAAYNFMTSNYGGFPLSNVELLLVFQDKIFWTGPAGLDALYGTYVPGAQAGDLWYPYLYERARWKVSGPGKSLPIPSVVAEFFGDTMLVNGTVNPEKAVNAGAYWMRTLNACNARFLNLSFVYEATDPVTGLPNGEPLGGYLLPTPAPVNVWVVGTEGGFLPAAKQLFAQGLPVGGFVPTPVLPGPWLNGPAERFELIVDFSACAGRNVLLYNDAQAPFPAGSPLNDYYPGAPKNPIITTPGQSPNTRTLMRFKVSTTAGMPLALPPTGDLSASNPVLPTVPDPVNGGLMLPAGFTGWTNPKTGEIYTFTLPATAVNGANQNLTLNENFDIFGRLQQLVGTTVPLVKGTFGRAYLDPPTENISTNTIEIWNIFNLTADTHPMHVHEFNGMILRRRPFQVGSFNGVPNYQAIGIGPNPGEEGWKETFKMNPGECITLAILVEDPMPTTYAGVPKYARGPYTIPGTTTVVQRPTVVVGAFTGTLPISPRLQASYAVIGDEYVWHCHILEHEEHDMMRPLVFHYPGA